MSKRAPAALVALGGIFVALYLALYKLGYIGTLTCAVGSCEVVQTSKWATFLGIPVASWGVVYYAALFVILLVSLGARWVDDPRVSRALVVVTGVGLLFSAWLTYLELFVIHAICQWCVISAILATILFVIAWLDLRDTRSLADETAADAAAGLRAGRYGMKNTEEIAIRATREE